MGEHVSQIPIGEFVAVGDDIGHLISDDGTQAVVEFFDAPVPDGIIRREVPSDNLRRVTLEQQSRVWWNDGGRWRIGRVVGQPDNVSDSYRVALPDNASAELSSDQLSVRWARPNVDPVRLIIAGTTEGRFFHRHRSAFVHALLGERSAAEGLFGITSSGIQLHRHQVRAARRVLLDPVRRYLLADEVGLGKTIEAGMVIRQTMLDHHQAKVLVLAPGPLVAQWGRELDSKFRVQGLGGGCVDIKSHSWLETNSAKTKKYSLVVIDEAHRLTSVDANPSAFEHLQVLARKSPGFLLLTATPVRSNEDAFLRLLHLLDPEIYRLEDLDAFRVRIERRDAVANAVALLAGDTPLILMAEGSALLREAFPEDAELGQLLDDLGQAFALKDGERARVTARRAKNYVSETYRIHRRLIRARRTGDLRQRFPVRRRQRSARWQLTDMDSRRRSVVESLDRFRNELVSCSDLPRAEILRVISSRCCAASPAIAGLRDALLGESRDDLTPGEISAVDTLGSHRLGQELGQSLSEALGLEELDDRIEQATNWAWSNVGRQKVAAVSAYTSVARATYERMCERYGDHRVACLSAGMSADELENEAYRARTDDLCVLLVCDSIAEEGWNLQFAQEVLHMDVPWDTNRLEQRLGRFDRFTPDRSDISPVSSTVFIDNGELDQLTGQWIRLVDEGFDVFAQSSATLQYAIPGREEMALDRALEFGFSGISQDLEDERVQMAELRRHIEGQDILDAIEDSADDERYFEQLVASDRRSDALRAGFDDWVCKALNFSRSPGRPPWSFSVSKRNPVLLTESTVRRLGVDRLSRKYVFDRSEADGFSLVRSGEPIADALLDLCLEDDRGLAFASYVGLTSIPQGSESQPVFFFDVVIGPKREISGRYSQDSLIVRERQSLSLLAPFIESIWLLPGRGEPPQSIQAKLQSEKSLNLGKTPEFFADLTAGMDWAATCRAVEEEAKSRILGRDEVRERLEQAVTKSDERQRMSEAQFAARAHSLGETVDTGSLTAEFESVRALVIDPVVRIDNCGVVFIGPEL